MKKIVASVIFVLLFPLCGCSEQGYKSELTQQSWSASLKGGGEARLSFEDDTAELLLQNGGESVSLSGKYIADESTLVIFVPGLGQNYGFDYTVSGSTLTLSRGDGELVLNSNGD